jgi:hypothetical protein
VTGTGFVTTTTVQVGGVADATSYVSATEVTATVTPQQLASGAQLSVIALNGTASSGSGAAVNLEVTNPVPAIMQTIPATVMLGAVSPVVSVAGTGFVPTTVIDVNGSARTTIFVSATQVDVALAAADMAVTGSLSLTAVNATPGGGTSAAAAVAVNNPPPGGPITISPSLVLTGTSTPTTVTVTGKNFLPASTVVLGGTNSTLVNSPTNGVAVATTYVSATQLTFQLSVAQQATTQQLEVWVVNPAPGGGSAAYGLLNILQQTPTPALTSVSPTQFYTGSNATTITIYGSDLFSELNSGALFANYSSVLWNGTALTIQGYGSNYCSYCIGGTGSTTTTVNSYATTPSVCCEFITAAVPASLLATVGTATITVNSTTATPALSNAVTVTIANPPAPTLTSLYPNSGLANSAATVALYGTGFTANSTVLLNGASIATSYESSTELMVTIPASSIATPGVVNLAVTTPAPGGGTSAALPFTAYNPPAPTLTSLSPNAGPINTAAAVTLYGTGFTASSTVAMNGMNITATFVSSTELTVAISASSVTLPGNLNFTVTTPAPGGGTTASLPYTAYIGIPNNSMVYNPVNGLFYVSVPSSAGAPYGNSVVSVDPETGALGTPIPVGSDPDQMAISSDGTILWVGLDGASAVRQVNLTTGTAGLQFSLGANGGVYDSPPTALALAALPGSPNSVVVATEVLDIYEGTIGIYDSGVLRGSSASGGVTNTFYALLTNGSKNEIYAGGSTYNTFTYSASGLTALATVSTGNTYASSTSKEMQIAGGVLYTDSGQAFDAESGGLLGTFYLTGTTAAQGPTVADTTLGLVFVLDDSQSYSYGSYNQIQSFNLTNYTSTGSAVISVGVPGVTNYTASSYPSHLTRWGTNGLAFRDSLGVFSLRSNLVKDLSAVNADLGVTLTASGGATTGTNTTYKATVTDAGPSASTNVALTAQLPANDVLISVTPSSGTCSVSSGVSCDLGGLANRATATVTIVVMQTAAGSATATVQVSGSENDPNTANNSATATVTVTGSTYNLSPTLSTITPTAIESGSSDTTITVTGAGFGSGSTVMLSAQALVTSYTSSSALTATVPAAQLANLGWAAVTVSNSAPGGGTSNPLPLTVFQVLTLGANHILYDPYSGKIMASVGSGSSSVTGNSIVAITPETAAVGTPVPIGSQPENMALTSDGQVLYTILTGNQSVAVFNMLTQTAEFTYAIQPGTGTDTNPAPRGIAAQPGTENTVAIDLGSWAGNAIYNFNPANQTAAIVGQASGPYSGSCISFLDAGDMLAFDTDTSGATLDHYTVTSAGFTYYDYSQYTESTLNGFGCFKLSGGLAFGNGGGVANPATVPATQIGVFPVSGGGEFSTSATLAPDTSLQSAFFMVDTQVVSGTGCSVPANFQGIYTCTYIPNTTVDGVESFNQNTFMPAGSVYLNMETIEGNTSYTGVDLIRWGQDGLAALTSSGNIYLLRGPFVTPQLLETNTAASLKSSSLTSITHGAGNTLLTLTGGNFVPGVAVTWNGNYRTTTIVDATHVTVAIPASDLVSAGSGSLVATNPGAAASGALTVTIN